MSGFSTYYELVGETPNQLVAGVLRDFPCARGAALDLGAGNMRDAKFLKYSGFERVVAVDMDAESLSYPADGIEIVISRAQNYRPGVRTFDLVISCNTLFFVKASEMEKLFSVVYKALRPGGLFAFNLLGKSDPWADPRYGRSSFQWSEIQQLARRYRIAGSIKVAEMGVTANGESKFWHMYSLVLQKR